MDFTSPLALEIKAAASASGGFEGYAARFTLKDLTGDRIMPGAFADSLAEHKRRGTSPPLLWAHNSAVPIGKLTLLREDDKGLFAEGTLTMATSAGAEAYALLKDDAVSGMSIGYSLPADGAEYREDARLLKRIELHEVSLVAIPAQPLARVTAVKAMDCESPRELEHLLRDTLSLSARKAKALANAAWPVLNGWDGQEDERDVREAEALARIAAELQRLNDSLTKGN